MEQSMTKRRWQPPPLTTEVATVAKLMVDEKVVRKMLLVNPSLRRGRTTFQVKKALERGERVAVADLAVDATPTACTAAPVAGRGGRELEETIAFFVRGKTERWQERPAELAQRRRDLDEAEQRAKVELRQQLASFVALLDDQALALSGRTALAKHAGLLSELGTTVDELLVVASTGKRRR
jgi:hypothetical protein